MFAALRKIYEPAVVKPAEPMLALPSQDEIDTILSKTRHSPDMAMLRRSQWQLVFAYGEEMHRRPMNRYLFEGARPLAPVRGFTLDRFAMWKKTIEGVSYPFLINTPFDNAPLAKICGEVWLVPSPQMKNIDNYRVNGVQYTRRWLPIVINYHENVGFSRAEGDIYKKMTQIIKAWVYVGVDDYWVPQLDGGLQYKPVKTFPDAPYRRDYYFFRPQECDE